LFVIACNSERETGNAAPYFDLKTLVKTDIDHNNSMQCGEQKSVLVNTIRETKLLDSIRWEKELQPILECDINKPAWKGKFAIDTVKGDDAGKFMVQYKPLSEKINVKLLRIHFSDGKPESIFIVKQIRSFIFSSNQSIEYFPGKGFSVRGEQKAAMMESFALNVDVKYSCK
jgi:hypothetical protein